MINDYLQISAELYKFLSQTIEEKISSESVDKINELLDEREKIVTKLKNDFMYDATNKTHAIMFELDKGIREKLDLIMDTVKDNIKDLQLSKKVERQYIDPYEEVRHLNARYFDGKK
jgi:flagellar protein FliT